MMGILEDLQARVERLEDLLGASALSSRQEYLRLPAAAKYLGLKDGRTVRSLIDRGLIVGAVELEGLTPPVVVVPRAALDAYQARCRVQKAVR